MKKSSRNLEMKRSLRREDKDIINTRYNAIACNRHVLTLLCCCILVTPITVWFSLSKIKIKEKYQISFCKILKNKLYHAKKLLKWSHDRILSTDSKNRTTLHVFIIDSGSESVKQTQKLELHYMSP